MKQIFSLYSFLFFSITVFSQKAETIELSHNWEFRQFGKSEWLPAKVPGCVHLDLIANKLLEDPFLRINEKEAQWVESEAWEYRTFFEADEKLLKKERIELVFEGLDTYAKVFLNGKEIFLADNMFRTWSIPCKGKLKKGRNEIMVHFASAVQTAKEAARKILYSLPGGEKSYVRKAAFPFGWDFAPRLVTCGIWKPVFLKIFKIPYADNFSVSYKMEGKTNAVVSASLDFYSDKPVQYDFFISDKNSGKIYFKKLLKLKRGKNTVSTSFNMDSLKLWWPRGLGDPFMYGFSHGIKSKKETIFADNFSLGFRNIELVQEKDTIGTSFYFKVNGIPFFIKGSNYVPPDVFVTRNDSAVYQRTIRDAILSNMNMLRVWGGGIYESDIFYDLCDKYGLLVWQDFMFACAMYPTDSAFAENVKMEAEEQVTRLRKHPCIALWCGNNEVDEGWKNWGWQKQYNYSAEDSSAIWNAYLNIFEKIFPETVNELHPSCAYISTSPKIGWGREASMTEGDSHYWGVWWGNEPFEMYSKKTGRFMSEFGFQSIPSVSSLLKFANKTEIIPESAVMAVHQKNLKGYQIINEYMARDYKMPTDNEHLIYISQLLQAYGMKTAIESHRRMRHRCMGTMYWQFNDCWPAVSWSGIDYYGTWKASQFFIKKLYQNFLISITEENGELKFWLVSDAMKKQSASLVVKVMDFNGKIKFEKSIIVEVPGNSSKSYFSLKIEDIVGKRSKDETLVSAVLKFGDEILASNIYYFLPPKDLALPEPKISFDFNQEKELVTVFLKVDKLAKNVYIYSEEDCHCEDNFFDMLPGEERSIKCKTASGDKVKVISLFNTLQEK